MVNHFHTLSQQEQHPLAQHPHIQQIVENKTFLKSMTEFFQKNVQKVISLLVLVFFVVLIITFLSCKQSFVTFELHHTKEVQKDLNTKSDLRQAKNKKHTPFTSSKEKKLVTKTPIKDQDKELEDNEQFNIIDASSSTPNKVKNDPSKQDQQQDQLIIALPETITVQKKKKRQENSLLAQEKKSQLQDQSSNLKKNDVEKTNAEQLEFANMLQNIQSSKKQDSLKNVKQSINLILRDQDKEFHRDIAPLNQMERKAIIGQYIKQKKEASSTLELAQFNDFLSKSNSHVESEYFKTLSAKYNVEDYVETNNICVILTTHNNAKNRQIIKTLNSIYNQHYKDYEVVIVDRASIDKTYDVITHYLKENIKFQAKTKIIQLEDYSQASALFQGTKQCKKDSISIIIDGNSELLSKNVFKVTDLTFQSQGYNIVYSNQFLLDTHRKTLKLLNTTKYDESQDFMKFYRNLPKRYGNYFSYRTRLGLNIPETYLNFNENLFQFTGADAFTKSILELGCGKVKKLNEPFLLTLFDSSIEEEEKVKRKKQLAQIAEKKKLDVC